MVFFSHSRQMPRLTEVGNDRILSQCRHFKFDVVHYITSTLNTASQNKYVARSAIGMSLTVSSTYLVTHFFLAWPAELKNLQCREVFYIVTALCAR